MDTNTAKTFHLNRFILFVEELEDRQISHIYIYEIINDLLKYGNFSYTYKFTAFEFKGCVSLWRKDINQITKPFVFVLIY